jgi:hypothetical protein
MAYPVMRDFFAAAVGPKRPPWRVWRFDLSPADATGPLCHTVQGGRRVPLAPTAGATVAVGCHG